jgi:hypothetical protein
MAADMAIGRGGHEIAALEVPHLGSQLFDGPRDFMTEDDRHADASPIDPVSDHDIMEADAASADRNPDLTRSGFTRRDLCEAQDFGRTGTLGDDGTHRRLSSPRASPR